MSSHPRHPVHSTFIHLGAAGFVLLIALVLGVVGKWSGVAQEQLAQTASGGWTYSTTTSLSDSTTNTTSATLSTVTFGAERLGITCTAGVTRAKYRFSITPSGAGYIMLTTPTSALTVGATRDEYLTVGGYSWSGSPLPGYMGTNYGLITVEELCIPETPTTVTPTTTTGDTLITATPPPPPASTSLVPVSFAAQPAPTARCLAGLAPMTPVFFSLTKPYGGYFLLSSDTGMHNAPYEWGEHYLPNGQYEWVGRVKSGYTSDEPSSGRFELRATCDTSPVRTEADTLVTPALPITSTTTMMDVPSTFTSSPQTTVSSPLTPELPRMPRPMLSLFVDNTPMSLGRTFNQEEVELRISTLDAKRVAIVLMDGVNPSKTYSEATPDDLLSRPGVDVWTSNVDMSALQAGKYRIQARISHTDGRESQTEPYAIAVMHPEKTAAMNMTTIAPSSADLVMDGGVSTSVRVTEKDKKQLLARISDPSSCTNAQECEIYCRSHPGVKELCAEFARKAVTISTKEAPSLIEVVTEEKIAHILRGETRPTELPVEIEKPRDLRDYCAVVDNFDVCSELLVNADAGVGQAVMETKREEMRRARVEERSVLTDRVGTRLFVDTDRDGVTDYDEVAIYRTDPSSADTDSDGYSDGAELLARTNPRGGVTTGESTTTVSVVASEEVEFVSPLIAGETEPELLQVEDVKVIEVGVNEHGSSTIKKMKLSGKAQPNSFVTVYIFSEPIVVTVKADATGAWTYTLEKELPDGTHHVYSAITDAGGRILAKSEPLPFVKVAAAVSLGAGAIDSVPEPGFFSGASLYAMIAMLIGILGVALSIIGFIVHQKGDETPAP
jgi:hypothetical protein